ncbi:hypothetical protein BR93DRAFT_967443 [Coniochaeta sp. PMI_546]|nr:hypothetical protein BR93DRAFT_967443 [Coniochaeta sp. PMI_546]
MDEDIHKVKTSESRLIYAQARRELQDWLTTSEDSDIRGSGDEVVVASSSKDETEHADRRALSSDLRHAARKIIDYKSGSGKVVLVGTEAQLKPQDQEASGSGAEIPAREEQDLNLLEVQALINSAQEALREEVGNPRFHAIMEDFAEWWEEKVQPGIVFAIESLEMVGSFCLALAYAIAD